MALTGDLGHRVDLVSMDPHFQDISIGLYQRWIDNIPIFLVHSYSNKEKVHERLHFVARAMVILGGLEPVESTQLRLQFPCHAEHTLACRRVFLEACKLNPDEPVQPRPLRILDKKSGRTITVLGQGGGAYQLIADGEESDKSSRLAAVANGLMKLGQMQPTESAGDCVSFSCGHPHDALVGLLLVRALNVRAILREQEMAATRGILSAPSAQK